MVCMINNEKCLITDFDNTLFDWFDNWYQAFDGALEYIYSQVPSLNRETFLNDIKNIHIKHNTTEYLNVFYQIGKYHKYKNIPNFYEICSEATLLRENLKEQNLHLFSKVIDTFKILKEHSFKLVIFTESEAFSTATRIKKLNLDGIIDYIYAPPAKNFGDISLQTTQLISFEEQAHYKPEKRNLEKIVNDLHLNRENCYYLGDSLIKDIKMAQNAKIIDIYAKYGENYKNKPEYALLKKVTFWQKALVKAEEESNSQEIKPTYILNNSIYEIIDILKEKGGMHV